MYPLRLNLIDENKKKRIVKAIQFEFIQNILQILLISISFTAMILLMGKYLIRNYFSEIISSNLTTNFSYNTDLKDIGTINKTLKEINNLQKEYIEVTPLLLYLSSTTPEGITFNTININYKNKSIILSGKADTRENFLEFQNILKNSLYINEPTFPISDLTKKENIVFNISASLK
ncbi:MAG: PilN domain-containing protein [Candidatus Magasanikbacteria bacterium]